VSELYGRPGGTLDANETVSKIVHGTSSPAEQRLPGSQHAGVMDQGFMEGPMSQVRKTSKPHGTQVVWTVKTRYMNGNQGSHISIPELKAFQRSSPDMKTPELLQVRKNLFAQSTMYLAI